MPIIIRKAILRVYHLLDGEKNINKLQEFDKIFTSFEEQKIHKYDCIILMIYGCEKIISIKETMEILPMNRVKYPLKAVANIPPIMHYTTDKGVVTVGYDYATANFSDVKIDIDCEKHTLIWENNDLFIIDIMDECHSSYTSRIKSDLSDPYKYIKINFKDENFITNNESIYKSSFGDKLFPVNSIKSDRFTIHIHKYENGKHLLTIFDHYENIYSILTEELKQNIVYL